MPQILTVSVAQPSTSGTLAETLADLSRIAQRAADNKADLLLLPEAYIGGYPRGCSFGAKVGGRNDVGREQFLRYWREAVDLGDTPRGDPEWANYTGKHADANGTRNGSLTGSNGGGSQRKGDGTREQIEAIARQTGVFLVVGAIERAGGGSLYCAALYVCPRLGCIGKRRKVMPTGTERLVWAQGDPSTLRAVTTTIRGVDVTLAAAICWENYMPLLRHALYSQNVNLYLAPTADARDTWLSLMRTVACEGRCYVLSACMCTEESQVAGWISDPDGLGRDGGGEETAAERPPMRRASTVTKTEDNHEITWPGPAGASKSTSGRKVSVSAGSHELRLPVSPTAVSESPFESGPAEAGETAPAAGGDAGKAAAPRNFVCRGGSCIVAPNGDVLGGPLWEEPDGMLTVTIDFDECIKGRLDFDAAGSYSRSDAFELKVRGLDLTPPS